MSPFQFPTMWQAPEIPELKLHVGPVDGKPPATLVLPGRDPRPEDEGLAARLPPRTAFVDPELYVPTVKTIREGSHQRVVERVTVDGTPGTLVRKTFDSGRSILGGVLDNLLVDVKASENFRILDGQPLSDTGFTRYETTLQRGDRNPRVERKAILRRQRGLPLRGQGAGLYRRRAVRGKPSRRNDSPPLGLSLARRITGHGAWPQRSSASQSV